MPYRIAVQFAVGGDLRFLSHQDSMKLFERAAVRAGLPLRWGQGFNPHVRLSLPLPRPVGVASDDELVVLELEELQPARDVSPASRAVPGPGGDAEMVDALGTETPGRRDAETPGQECQRPAPTDLLARLAAQMPADIRLRSIREVPAVPQPQSVRYSLVLAGDCPSDLPARIAGLLAAAEVVVRRRVDEKGTDRPVDIRPYIETVRCDTQAARLDWTLRVTQAGSARPGEVLAALGLDPADWLHRVTREHVDWQSPPASFSRAADPKGSACISPDDRAG